MQNILRNGHTGVKDIRHSMIEVLGLILNFITHT